jgi:colanic acid biosynthesis glycosyl transferase WcaI
MMPELARALKAEDPALDIEIIASRNRYRGGDDQYPPEQDWEGVRVLRLGTPRSNQDSTALRLLAGLYFSLVARRRLLSLPRYDLLLVGTNPPSAPLAALALRRKRHTPYVYLIHDLYPDVAVSLGALRATSKAARVCAWAQRRWLHGAARVVAIGRCMRDYLADRYGLDAEQIEVITNWSRLEGPSCLPAKTQFRARHGLSEFVVLYAGNFGRYQDFGTILDAAAMVRATHPDITFVFVGDGAKRPEIAARMESGAAGNSLLLPFVPDEEFADLLAAADVSLVTLEAGAEAIGVPSKFYNILASGRPTVAVVGEGSEVARLIAEESCGLRVAQGDAAGLVQAVVQLAANPETAAQMGERARSAFEHRFTLRRIAEQYLSLFSEVLAEGTRP